MRLLFIFGNKQKFVCFDMDFVSLEFCHPTGLLLQNKTKQQQTNRVPAPDSEQNGLMGRVDEGVDEFFSKKVAKMDSK